MLTGKNLFFRIPLVHPRLFQFGHLVIPTYGVLAALALATALFTCMLAARLLELDTAKVWNLALAAFLAALVSAKLALTVTGWPNHGALALTLDLASAPRAIVPGILVGIVAGWIYGHHAALPLRRTADALAPALAAAGSILWLARLEAGYAFGAISHGPLAIVFSDPHAAPGVPLGVPLHPVQIYGAMIDFVWFILLFLFLRLPHRDGDVMGALLFLNGLSSFFLTFLRGDDWARIPLAGFLSGSQWVAIAMVLAGGALWLHRKTGPAAGDAAAGAGPACHAQ